MKDRKCEPSWCTLPPTLSNTLAQPHRSSHLLSQREHTRKHKHGMATAEELNTHTQILCVCVCERERTERNKGPCVGAAVLCSAWAPPLFWPVSSLWSLRCTSWEKDQTGRVTLSHTQTHVHRRCSGTCVGQ